MVSLILKDYWQLIGHPLLIKIADHIMFKNDDWFAKNDCSNFGIFQINIAIATYAAQEKFLAI